MLTSEVELPADPVLPGVPGLLDAQRVLDLCRERLGSGGDPAAGSSWTFARMIEALYHPGRYLRVAYALLDEPDLPTARCWPQGQVVYLHQPARLPISRRGDLVNVDGVPTELYAFPNDRRLRGLRKFTGRCPAVQTWQGWLDQAGDPFRIDDGSLRRALIRYVPEQKWIARLRGRGVEAASGAAAKRSIAVRSARAMACRQLFERHAALAQLTRASSLPFRVPEVVGCDRIRGLLAVEWVRGSTLVEAIRSDGATAMMSRLSSVLQAFHRLPVADLSVTDDSRVVGRACAAAAELTAARPDLTGRLAAVVRGCARHLADAALPRMATLHNDFHWNQVRIQGDRVALLDFERMSRGDPLLDVANFVTQVRMLGHRPESTVDSDTADVWASEFLKAWVQCDGRLPDDRRLAGYAILSSLELANGMMRHLRPGWHGLTERCLEQAELHAGCQTAGVQLP